MYYIVIMTHMSQPPKTALWSVQPYLHSSLMCQTHRQTHRPCYMWHLYQ